MKINTLCGSCKSIMCITYRPGSFNGELQMVNKRDYVTNYCGRGPEIIYSLEYGMTIAEIIYSLEYGVTILSLTVSLPILQKWAQVFV